MGFDFGQKKQEQPMQEQMRMLATQVETINQQLAGGSIGGGEGGPALGKAFNDLNAKLTYIYEYLKTLQRDLREDQKESMLDVKKTLNATLQKNMKDIFDTQAETQKRVEAMAKRLDESPAFNMDEITEIRKTIRTLVDVYKEEVGVFRKQNEFLQQKLISIEQKLGK